MTNIIFLLQPFEMKKECVNFLYIYRKTKIPTRLYISDSEDFQTSLLNPKFTIRKRLNSSSALFVRRLKSPKL